ncbi:TPA: hypothetical protein ACIRGN_001911 [Streptococcus suis]|uniref:hypothetical protein n=1 Tax=Streptococcus suis TaxID=1307 RepID=UPI00040C3441|nr:hypothetical protein [Streptococcus suis]MDW8637057.1 hypothetical protein [Streptococcus suis]HEL2723740.1 hypothetical protein [Streptococcus suis]HEM3176539.1 hypothetical protein [Streptococcus suis]HEM3922114.1 hypothetical protein [Streptococcus suis]
MNKQEAIEELERNVVRTTDFDRAEDVVILRDELNEFESEFYTTDDFTTPIECLSEALDSIQSLYEDNRIEDKENAERLIESYKNAIELLRKMEVE